VTHFLQKSIAQSSFRDLFGCENSARVQADDFEAFCERTLRTRQFNSGFTVLVLGARASCTWNVHWKQQWLVLLQCHQASCEPVRLLYSFNQWYSKWSYHGLWNSKGSRVTREFLGAFLGKNTPENAPITSNSLFPDDSTDSEDLADELDKFFRFMIRNDLWKKRKMKNQNFPKSRSWEVLSLLRTFLLLLVIITDDDPDDMTNTLLKNQIPV